MKHWYIYRITNRLGQSYIGKSSDLNTRIKSHRNMNHYKGSPLVKSIKEYGWGSHRVEIMDEFEGDDNYADGKEVFWIRTCMTNRNKYPEIKGLNLTNGGKGCYGHVGAFKGQKRSKEVGLAISKGRFKKVIQYTKYGSFVREYESGLEAARILGVSNKTISSAAIGKNLTCKGFILKYA